MTFFVVVGSLIADVANMSIRQTVKRSIYTVLTHGRDRLSMPALLPSITAENVLTGNPDRLAVRKLFFNLSCSAVVALFVPRANTGFNKFQLDQILMIAMIVIVTLPVGQTVCERLLESLYRQLLAKLTTLGWIRS
ncbi:MAG TPA: hypothetical protein VGO51_03760 [Burkholderiaceae bacterium]|jgi:hypothetical protein|nr:hypothetical protein [Burkholderiaceae bacterium]